MSENGNVIVSTLRDIGHPATASEVAVRIDQVAQVGVRSLMPTVKQTLNGGARLGYLQQQNGLFSAKFDDPYKNPAPKVKQYLYISEAKAPKGQRRIAPKPRTTIIGRRLPRIKPKRGKKAVQPKRRNCSLRRKKQQGKKKRVPRALNINLRRCLLKKHKLICTPAKLARAKIAAKSRRRPIVRKPKANLRRFTKRNPKAKNKDGVQLNLAKLIRR